MVRQQYQTRLDADDARRVEEYQDEHNISEAEAMRRLVRRGLDHTDDDEASVENIQDDLDEILSRLDNDASEETDTKPDILKDEPLRGQYNDINRADRTVQIAGGAVITFLLISLLIINLV
ncbi:hypothetical protein [Haloquadratum walsbyi]|uniref:Uncharacterized protein n=1 Tax=Haloquadratum walsbyi (strain DSM 16854 / JCM 12705 / C23) TaxID=768065 RepID=G0LNG5_HALWC|nr:hypothetical protein [Haloquadratum walsbyi]CCC41971.1 conserved hypothetical protein [Haloquadratum walsbyi C23]